MRKRSQYGKRLLGIVAAFCIFGVIVDGLNFVYVDPTDGIWTRKLWHHFYEDKGKIENVYLGSSHVYCDLDPVILDGLNGKYNFNLASGSQVLNGSFYLLKEAGRFNPLEHVYVELYYLPSTKSIGNPDDETLYSGYQNNWRNIDYMKPSANKWEYIVSSVKPEKYIDTCLPFVRFRGNLSQWGTIKDIMERKSSEEYLAYEYLKSDEENKQYIEYREKGYYYSTEIYQDSERMFFSQFIMDEKPMKKDSEKYLRKIIAYCQKREIPVTLFISPIDALQLTSTEHYDCYVEQVREIAAEYAVDFYDFNLVREEYLPIQEGRYFKDAGHLNHKGAEMFTRFFHETVSRDMEENKAYFYDSYAEKCRETEPAVYGIYYRNIPSGTEEGEMTRGMWVASNRDAGMEYRIIMTPENEEAYLVQDFEENNTFTVEWDEHGICTIVARMKEAPDEVQTLEVVY